MEHKRRLVLAVILKTSSGLFDVNELRFKSKSADSELTLEARASKCLNLKACFAGFSQEETLSGNDQWYCNVCREHRDITKKLEIYSAPKILILQLKRFQ